MICPKCDFEQPESDECASCGIIVAKYKALAAKRKTFQNDSVPTESNILQWIGIILLSVPCFLGLVGIHDFIGIDGGVAGIFVSGLFVVFPGVFILRLVLSMKLGGRDKTADIPETMTVPCPSCADKINVKVMSCPKCGYVPKRGELHDLADKCLAVDFWMVSIGVAFSLLLILTFTLGGVFDGSSKPSTSWTTDDNSSMAAIMTEEYVKQRLKSPASADFPRNYQQTEHKGNQTYYVQGVVDSQNSFGAMVRARYTGLIKQVSSDEWQMVTLSVL